VLKSIVRCIEADSCAARLRIAETQASLAIEILLSCVGQKSHQLIVCRLKASNTQKMAKLFQRSVGPGAMNLDHKARRVKFEIRSWFRKLAAL
jgi:hypothetical protein